MIRYDDFQIIILRVKVHTKISIGQNCSQRKQITWILHKNPHSSKMTSAEGVTGLDKKSQKSQHATVNNITNGANTDLLLMELVNGFVQEILRKGIAKYQEDINAQRPKVKVINFGLIL